MKIIWILTDDRAGNNAQTFGVAEKLGLPYIVKEIKYNYFAKLPNIIRRSTLIGVDNVKSMPLIPPYPDIVIASGRKLAPIARFIKKQAKIKEDKEVKLVHIMSPDCDFRAFSLIALPQHDRNLHADNVVSIIGAPHRLNDEFFKQKKKEAKKMFAQYQAPYVAVLLGGDTKFSDFSPTDASEFANQVLAFCKTANVTPLISSSRRTGEASLNAFRDVMNKAQTKYFLFDFTSGTENPYFDMLTIADYLIISADSISMISESLATKKPVFIFNSENITSKKHKKFVSQLIHENHAIPLQNFNVDSFTSKVKAFVPLKYDAATVVVEKIKSFCL